MRIRYLIGDATLPVKKPAMISHCNNDIGGWGCGFVLALRDRYPLAEKRYRQLFQKEPDKAKLGYAQIVKVDHDVFVANMIAQHGIRWQGKTPPIRYDALEQTLQTAYAFAKENGLAMHMPRIGCVLAGGSWDQIEPIIQKTMTVDTFVYTLANQADRWGDFYEQYMEE